MNELLVILSVSIISSGIAYFLNFLDLRGALAAFFIFIGISFLENTGWTFLLIFFMYTGSFATKYKSKIKEKTIINYYKKRSYVNVLANGSAPLIFAFLGNPYGYIASIACVSSDTLSSELGVLTKSDPVSILDLRKKVQRGENGGISIGGTAIGIVTSIIFGIVGYIVVTSEFKIIYLAVMLGTLGNFVDSFLGATLENKKIINGHIVNFLSSLLSGTLAMLI